MKISSLIKRFILINAFVAAIAGCGSGSSGLAGNTNTATPTGGTGSIAAKLVWNGSGSAKSTGKTLYAAPSGVNIIKVLVYDGFTLIKFQDFDAGLGTGTINAIPIGAGYKVKIWGLVSGTLVYEGIVENVTVEMNKTTNLGTIVMASITKASPDFGNYTAPQYV
ncbi:MAG: hypothetical protein HXX17_15940, partial [Geobacteraceae bacterium]|nr:hypothetical protein [Geobacteraceae bacterium]